MMNAHTFVRVFRNMWGDSTETGNKFVGGSFVLLVGRVAIKAVQFIRTIVIARLLFPEDLGLFGLAALSLSAIDLFLQPGFYAALVHEREDPHQYLDTAWSGHIIRNAFIGVIVFISAPFLGDFFGHPDIVSLTRVLALSLVIGGFENIGVALFQREMRFNRLFFLNMSTVLLEVTVVIVAGFILRNAWALVVGSIANRAGTVLFSYLFHPYRPKFAPRWSHFRHLFRYSKWISLGAIVSYFVAQGDNFSVGKLIGAEGLGYYQAAFALALIPVAEFGRVLGNALFPMFARIETERYEEAFTRVAQLIFVFTIPASLGIYALAPDIVENLYGTRWMPMVPIVSVLAFYALVRSFEAVGSPFFMGIGKPKIMTMALFVQCVAMAFLLPVFLIKFSLIGAAWAMFWSGTLSASVYIFAMYREKLFTLWGIFRLIGAPIVAAAIMVLAIKSLKVIISIGNFFELLLAITAGALLYFSCLWCFDRLLGGSVFANFRWVRERMLKDGA